MNILPFLRRAAHCGGLLLLLFADPLFASPSGETGRPLLRTFSPRDYEGDPLCQALGQDADGVLFVANNTDALAYDGAAWQWIDLPPESTGIFSFARDAEGTLFAGGSHVLGYFRGPVGRKEFVSLLDRLSPADRDRGFIVASLKGVIHCASEEKLFIWHNRRFTEIAYPAALGDPSVHTAADSLFVGGPSTPLYQLVGDHFEPFANDPALHADNIVLIEPATADRWTVLTSTAGFLSLDSTGHVTPILPAALSTFAGKQLRHALRLPDRSLAVSFTALSGNGGVHVAPDGTFLSRLDESIGLPNRALRDFFCDREGGLWVGLESGLARLECPSAFSLFDPVNGLHGFVTEIARHEGALYAATIEGLHRLNPGDAPAGLAPRFERIHRGPIYSLRSHRDVLLARGRTDLFLVTNDGLVSLVRLPASIGGIGVSKRDPNRLWLNTLSGVHAVYRTPGGWHHEGALPGFTGHAAGLTELPDGSLWISSFSDGLALLRFPDPDHPLAAPPLVERFTRENGLPAGVEHVGITEWRREPLFLFNTLARPHRFEASLGHFLPLAGTESLPASALFDCWSSSASADHLWFTNNSPKSSRHTIYRLRQGRGTPEPLPHVVAETAGKIWQMREESSPQGPLLWICSSRGLLRVELDRAFSPATPFNTQLHAAELSPGDRLPASRLAIEFEFSAPRLRNATEVEYQTRLSGYDDAWSPWSSDRKRTFTHLPPGTYRFEVRARDPDGALASPASLAFTQLPPWWRTWWAYGGGALVALSGVAGIVRLRTRTLRRRNERLEQTVRERTSTLSLQNLELARLHKLELDEKITAKLAAEKSRLETLRYQLNPHFLFNSLTSIRSQIPQNLARARDAVDRLADFCRATLRDDGGDERTTLGEEFAMLRSYLAIERSRLGDLLTVAIQVDPAVESEPLPRLLLLPLVENALKYGAATSADRLELRLSAHRNAADLVIEIANTGHWVDQPANHEVTSFGIGLENIRERLQRHFPHRHEFTHLSADGWVRVILRISPS